MDGDQIKSDNKSSESQDIEEDNNENQSSLVNEDESWDKIENIKKKKITDGEEESEEDDIDKEELQEEALLKTLNVVGKGKFHFNNFYDSFMNDSIPKFVMYFFNIQSIDNVHITQTKKSIKASPKKQNITKEEIKNINAVLEFLKTKEVKFQIMKFNFQDPITQIPSSILFYTNFLNFFFVKKLKREMYERCALLICTKYTFNDFENYSELTKLRVYSALMHLINERNLHFYFKILPNKTKRVLEMFQKCKIPMIINKRILKIGTIMGLPDSIFYQLQIIFDALDSGSKSLLIIALMLTFIYKCMHVHVPRYDIIASSIKAKRTSREFQRVRSEHYLQRQDSKNFSGSFSSSENILIQPTKEISTTVSTYKNRLEQSISNEEKNEFEDPIEKRKSMLKAFESYWNSQSPNLTYDRGIIYNKLQIDSQHQVDWIEAISELQRNLTKRKSDISIEAQKVQQTLLFKNSQNTIESKFYKIFSYNETNDEWHFESQIFAQLSIEKRINIKDSSTPLILILNSFEEDSISLTSNLISGTYPKFEEEQIFVYAFCDKSLSMLNFLVDFGDKIKASIKPIFLNLHVPQSKAQNRNIYSIAFRIYNFLSIISDLKIVLLNKDHYIDQIEFIKRINLIQNSFINKIKSNSKMAKSSSSESFNNNDDDDEKSEEEDELFEEEETWEDINNDNKKEINQKIDENILKIHLKQSKFILLVNEPTIEYSKEIQNKISNSQFFTKLKSQIEGETEIHYIKLNDANSYEFFLKTFNNLILKGCSTFSEIQTNFQCFKLTELSSTYINLRMLNENWKEELKKRILKRYAEFEAKQKNSFILITNLQNEISSISNSYDIDFSNECNSVLSFVKSEASKKNRGVYISELKISADSHLSFLEEKINKKFYWTEEQMQIISESHVRFLKNEFYSIIQMTNSENIYNLIYEDNIEILQKQIANDKQIIEGFFKSFIEKVNIKRKEIEQDIHEGVRKGANYAMRETENLKEIKVSVEVNKDLKSVIEQDF